MSRSLIRAAAAVVFTATVAAVAGMACARDGGAQVAPRSSVAGRDTMSVNRLLAVARGVDPVLCELVARHVDMHGQWSRWGPFGGNPLHVDSTAAALIDWIQQTHDDPAVVPRLRAGMRDADACVRRVSGSFLGRVDHASATEALIAALDDPSADTREVAAFGLGMGERRTGVEALKRTLRDGSASVRRAAAWALGAMEAPGSMDALIETLGRDTDPRVRQVAAWAIGRLPD